jgi:hypothetical protein
LMRLTSAECQYLSLGNQSGARRLDTPLDQTFVFSAAGGSRWPKADRPLVSGMSRKQTLLDC